MKDDTDFSRLEWRMDLLQSAANTLAYYTITHIFETPEGSTDTIEPNLLGSDEARQIE